MTVYLLPEEGREEEVLQAGGVDADGFKTDNDLQDLLNETRDFLERYVACAGSFDLIIVI